MRTPRRIAIAARPSPGPRRPAGPRRRRRRNRRGRRSSPGSSTGWSARRRAGASPAWPACRATRSPTTRPPPRAASGSPSDGGIRWKPVFDDQPTSSIGSIAVAPSDPNVVYVGLGRGQHPRQRGPGQRHLQVDRRRQDVAARVEAGRPDRHDGRPPEEPRRRLRGRARQAVRSQPRARRLPHARRRQDVGEGPLRGPRHRRLRRGPRPDEPARSSSPASGRRAAAPGSW